MNNHTNHNTQKKKKKKIKTKTKTEMLSHLSLAMSEAIDNVYALHKYAVCRLPFASDSTEHRLKQEITIWIHNDDDLKDG